MFVVHRMHPNLSEVREALLSAGHQCVFVVASIGTSEPEAADFRIVFRNGPHSKDVARDILTRQKPDLIVQRIFKDGFLSFWRSGKRLNIPCVRYSQDPHQIPFHDFLVRPLRVCRMLFDNARYRLILGAHRRITPVRYWGKLSKAHFVNSFHVPFPTTCKDPRKKMSDKVPTVLTVAKHGQGRKRVSWLVRAVDQSDPPFNLVIVGASPATGEWARRINDWRIRRKIRNRRNLSTRVQVLDNLDKVQMGEAYRSSDLFVLPAKREPMAISPLEALSHGIPVLVGSDGGAVSYVRPFGDELIFKSRSYLDFRKRLSFLLTNPAFREKLSGSICARLQANHSPETFVDQLSTLAQLGPIVSSRQHHMVNLISRVDSPELK